MTRLQSWQQVVLRAAAYGTGALLVLLPVIDWSITGQAPPAFLQPVATGLLLLLLPRLQRVPLATRTALLVGGLFVSIVVQGAWRGWAPSLVGASCALVVVASLLLPRRAVFGLVLLQVAAMLLGSRWAAVHDFGPAWAALEPGRFSNWVRITLFFVLIAGALTIVLRQVVDLVQRALLDASKDLRGAELHERAARQVRAARVEAARALRGPQRVQAVAELSAGLAHVLNDALTITRGAIEELRDDVRPAARDRAGAEVVTAARRVANAVRELMIFARREEGEPSGVPLREELERVVIGMGSTLRPDVRLAVVGDPRACAELSSARARQLVVALVLNATAAARSGGRIQLAVRPPAPGATEVELVVEDEGEGMEPAVRARATEAFFSTRDARFHAGLGLTVAVGIVEQLGGSLRIESRRGVGTRVRLLLPLDAETAGAAAQSEPALLHGEAALDGDEEPTIVATTVGPVEPRDEVPAVEDWRATLAARLGRISLAVLVGAVGASLLLTAFRAPSGALNLTLLVGVATLLVVVGWARRFTGEARSKLLVAALALLSTGQLAVSTFHAPIVLIGLLVTVTFATLLGPRGTGALTVMGLGGASLAIGACWSAGLLHGELGIFSPASPAHWLRVAFSLGVGQAALAYAVLAAMDRARGAVEALEAAQAKLAAAAAEEEREAARELALERARTNSERLAALGRAIGVIAHDLNNALQGLISEADGLRDPTLSPDEIETSRALLERAHGYACALATQFGGAGHASAGRAATVDLGLEVERTLEMLPALIRAGTTLERSIAPGCFVAIEVPDVRRLLFNLVTNARDALDGGGTIAVELERQGCTVTLRVRDTGHGMDEATRARVFEAFFSTKPEGKGTGLGLYSVARIMDATDGTIALRSEPGAGASFELSWPLQVAPDGAPVVEGAQAPRPPGRLVLLVEDEPAVRAFQTRTLRRAGFEVRAASDGASALSLVTSSPEGALLCVDGAVPGASAAEIIEAYRRSRPGQPVLVCSGQLPEELARRGLSRGEVSFLPKPFEPAQLCAAIEALAVRAD